MFWEEPVTNFHSIRHGSLRKRLLQKFVVAAETSLSRRCLVTIWGYIDPQIHASNNSFIVSCIYCRGSVFTEPLPSNDRRDTHTDINMEGICEVRHWDGLRCHDVHTKFHKYWFRHSKVTGVLTGIDNTEIHKPTLGN
jgi:hypothetical protein